MFPSKRGFKMIRSALLAVLALSGLSAVDASAAEVRVAYRGVVTQAEGTDAATFAAGQQILVSYVVETTIPDIEPSTNVGRYPDGLRELRVSVEGTGVDVVVGKGTVRVYDDNWSDFVLLYNTDYDNVSGVLGGLPVGFAEVDFRGLPAMISGDGIPTTNLAATEITVILSTSVGDTTLSVLLEADEPAATCASDGYKGAQLTWCQNICENGLTGKVLDTWIHRWVSRYRQLPYCAVDVPSDPK